MLSGEAVGGGIARTVRLEIGTGRLWLREGSGETELVPGFSNLNKIDIERRRQWHTGS